VERVFELFPRLAERRNQLGRQLSGGEQEMLALARPLLLNPQLMMLDEPSQGLAPLIVREVRGVVKPMRDGGLLVLLVEQNAALSLAVADRAYILDDGKIVCQGAAAELTRNQERARPTMCSNVSLRHRCSLPAHGCVGPQPTSHCA